LSTRKNYSIWENSSLFSFINEVLDRISILKNAVMNNIAKPLSFDSVLGRLHDLFPKMNMSSV